MTALQVFAILNKKIKGLVSGIKSAVVNGTTIVFTMNDGSSQTMTFPKPENGKDGLSVSKIDLKDTTVNGKSEKHLVFTMSDGSTIDSGKIENSAGVVQKNKKSQFPAKGDMNTLYIETDSETVFFWDGSSYKPCSSNSGSQSFEIIESKIEFDGTSDTFTLPEENIRYDVFVNGIRYTEDVDYSIDRSVSPNTIKFSEIYDSYELCSLIYIKPGKSSGGTAGGDCNCEQLEYATKTDIEKMFN